uniref:Potassium channel domain-containing protein n=1 Tax=Psilocybe cubensis TaxID=181762 RepID=A0A8H7XLI1_PSICU
MNDPGLGQVIERSEEQVTDERRYRGELERRHTVKHHKKRREEYGNDSAIYQPTLWWFSSTAFPLFAGTFGPVSNLFSVCALVQTWRISILDGKRVPDPPWLIAMNICSLVFALIANLILLFNFARRIPYIIAQPLTITLWYLASLFLLLPICLAHNDNIDPKPFVVVWTQSYYYALISCILYFCVSTLLLVSTLGATVFHAYKPSFATLTGPQRTLMLQTISFTLYLALGAGVFSTAEGWSFTDGVYWADYTLLTVGLGSDFPPVTTLGRMLLIPYAAFGITLLGLVVSSVRGLVLERAKTKVALRHLGKQREKWKQNIIERRHLSKTPDSEIGLTRFQRWRKAWKEKRLMRLPNRLSKATPVHLEGREHHKRWHRTEFELMRYIEENAERTERYAALTASFLVIIVVWIGGSLIFWSCELHIQSMTYVESLYFTYTTLLTIGYGDFYPKSFAGKPFFVVWSLISVPAMTVLISNMGDTVVKWVQDVTVWASRWTILPERDPPETLTPAVKPKHKRRLSVPRRREHVHIRHPSRSHRSHDIANDEKQSEEMHHDHTGRFERDIELLGEHVRGFEEEEGRGGSLAARLAREISHLAKDIRSNPPKKYSWEEWSRWLEMLGEHEPPEPTIHPPASPIAQSNSKSPPPEVLIPDALDRTKSQTNATAAAASSSAENDLEGTATSSSLQIHARHGQPNATENIRSRSGSEHDWHWSWLDDQGPLFSELTETEWIIEKLCFRMEEVLEDEIRQAIGEGGKHKSGCKCE